MDGDLRYSASTKKAFFELKKTCKIETKSNFFIKKKIYLQMFKKAFIIIKLAYHQVFMPKNDRLQVPSFHYNASNGAPRKRHFSVILATVQPLQSAALQSLQHLQSLKPLQSLQSFVILSNFLDSFSERYV